METRTSTAEAKATLSALIASAADGHRVVIERRGKPLAALVGMADLAIVKRETPTSPHPQGALVLVGAWGEVASDEVDSLIDDIYAQRRQDTGRNVAVER